uniref:Uncharacterized protein n=1 Tax=Cacopsylla melanoneura TaxID=428564 RepID=A0A8D8SB81_9HEMI
MLYFTSLNDMRDVSTLISRRYYFSSLISYKYLYYVIFVFSLAAYAAYAGSTYKIVIISRGGSGPGTAGAVFVNRGSRTFEERVRGKGEEPEDEERTNRRGGEEEEMVKALKAADWKKDKKKVEEQDEE